MLHFDIIGIHFLPAHMLWLSKQKIKLLNLHLHLLKKKYGQFWYHVLFELYLKVFCSTPLWLSNNMPVECHKNQQYKCNRSNTFSLEQAYSAVIAVAVGVWVRLQIRDECQIGQVWSVFLLPLSLSAQLFIMTDAAIDTGRQPLCSRSLNTRLPPRSSVLTSHAPFIAYKWMKTNRIYHFQIIEFNVFNSKM